MIERNKRVEIKGLWDFKSTIEYRKSREKDFKAEIKRTHRQDVLAKLLAHSQQEKKLKTKIYNKEMSAELLK